MGQYATSHLEPKGRASPPSLQPTKGTTTDDRGTRSLRKRRDEFERNLINEALEEYEGGVRRAARRLGMSRMGMSRTGLYKRIRILGVPLPSSEQGQADDSGGRD